jgi:hypothetical protein
VGAIADTANVDYSTVEPLLTQGKQTSDFLFFPFAENKQKFAVSLLHQTMEFAIFR